MVDFLRRGVASHVNRLVVGDDMRPLRDLPDDDPGMIPEDSPVRIVNQDASMFIGGVRALLYQTLHPDACYAVHEHSAYESDPLGRLQRTAYFLGATVYGSGTAGRQAVDVVRSIHTRVTGQLPDGRLYRADDPHLLGWVHATEVDSFLTAYKLYGSEPISEDAADRYVADMGIIAEALGADDLPQNQAELAAVLDMYRAECAATPECRDLTRFLFAPQLPLPTLPFYGVIFAASAAMLPAWARSMLLLPIGPGLDRVAIRPAADVLTRALRWAGPGERRAEELRLH
ncbi:MAG: oxygenase MpaB family protein [Actinomycetota bacterium]